MARSLNAIVSAIHGNTIKGLEGTQNKPYSFRQIADDVDALRGDMALSASKTRLFSARDFMQKFEVDCLEKSKECPLDFGKEALRFWIPPLMVSLDKACVSYAGPTYTASANSYHVYVDDVVRYHGVGNRRGARRPAVWINPAVTKFDEELGLLVEGWVINPEPVSRLLVRGVFSTPSQCVKLSGEEENYPVPETIEKKIVDTLTQAYLQVYRGGRQNGGLTAAQLQALQNANNQPQATDNQ